MPTPGMAAADAPGCQPEPFEDAVFFKGLQAVMRAGRRIAALRSQQGRDEQLVDPDQHNKGKGQELKQGLHVTSVFVEGEGYSGPLQVVPFQKEGATCQYT